MKKIQKVFAILFTVCAISAFSQNSADKSKFFTGDGKSDVKLDFINPEMQDVSDDDFWISIFMANTLSDNIRKYSNIEVCENHEFAHFTYPDKYFGFEFGPNGMVRQTYLSQSPIKIRFGMTGANSGLTFEFQVFNSQTEKAILDELVKNQKISDIENGTVSAKATESILKALGVELTAEGKKSLLDVSSQKDYYEAHKKIAKAQEYCRYGGDVVEFAMEAILYLFEARALDSSSIRPFDELTAFMSSQLDGQVLLKVRDPRNAQADGKAVFEKLYKAMRDYYTKNPPIKIVYQSKFPEKFNVKKGKNVKIPFFTAFEIKSDEVWFAECVTIKYGEWQQLMGKPESQIDFFDNDSTQYLLGLTDENRKISKNFTVSAEFELLDENKNVLATTKSYSKPLTQSSIYDFRNPESFFERLGFGDNAQKIQYSSFEIPEKNVAKKYTVRLTNSAIESSANKNHQKSATFASMDLHRNFYNYAHLIGSYKNAFAHDKVSKTIDGMKITYETLAGELPSDYYFDYENSRKMGPKTKDAEETELYKIKLNEYLEELQKNK